MAFATFLFSNSSLTGIGLDGSEIEGHGLEYIFPLSFQDINNLNGHIKHFNQTCCVSALAVIDQGSGTWTKLTVQSFDPSRFCRVPSLEHNIS
jgi:hypothetical protein